MSSSSSGQPSSRTVQALNNNTLSSSVEDYIIGERNTNWTDPGTEGNLGFPSSVAGKFWSLKRRLWKVNDKSWTPVFDGVMKRRSWINGDGGCNGRQEKVSHSLSNALLAAFVKKILTFVDRIDSPKNGIDWLTCTFAQVKWAERKSQRKKTNLT